MSADTYSDMSARGGFAGGLSASVPVIVAVLPFGILFGALAVENGLSVFEAILMSATVYGGASQMVGIDLFGQKIAPWLIVFAIFAVNFRHVLYSAAIGRRIRHWSPARKVVAFFFLTDPQFAESESRIASGKSLDYAWYMGLALPVYANWLCTSALGAVFGRMIPDTQVLGIDFLLPIYFLGLVMSFRERPLFVPVVVASAVVSVIAHQSVGSPWHVSIGAAAGIVVAILAPVRLDSGEGR